MARKTEDAREAARRKFATDRTHRLIAEAIGAYGRGSREHHDAIYTAAREARRIMRAGGLTTWHV